RRRPSRRRPARLPARARGPRRASDLPAGLLESGAGRPQGGGRARRARRNPVNGTAAAALAVEQTIRIRAPRERVFRLLTDLAEIPRWMPVTAFEPRVGGRVEFVKGEMHAEGEVTEFEPPRAIAYTWDWRNQPLGARTEVRFELAEDGDG